MEERTERRAGEGTERLRDRLSAIDSSGGNHNHKRNTNAQHNILRTTITTSIKFNKI